MPKASDKRGCLRQNLLDAGCDGLLVEQCMGCADAECWDQVVSLLSNQKKSLLKAVHARQKQIDCLDYLTYMIDKEHLRKE